MTAKNLRMLLEVRPFEPFRIHMLEGETHDVRHPEMVWVAGQSLFVGGGHLDHNGKLIPGDLEGIYGLNLIKKIEMIREATSTPNENGK